MLPKEILKNVRRIEITTSKLVTDVLAGQYQSVFKGQGIEFDEVREYQPGDEIRSIDWNVTARMGHPYVKKFVEERELTVMLVLDISRSEHFGSVKYLKDQLAAEICSLLAFSAIKNNDKVGLIAFTDKIEKFIPPRKGVTHVLRVVREALCLNPGSGGTDITGALQYLNRVTSRRAVTFLISDFFDKKDYKKALTIANKRHDVVAITITDPMELALPDAGLLKFRDAETGQEAVVDTSKAGVRKQYAAAALKRFKARQETLACAGVDAIDIRTDIPYMKNIVSFFRARSLKKR